MIKTKQEKIHETLNMDDSSIRNGVFPNVNDVKRSQVNNTISTITGAQMIKDILEQCKSIPQNVSITYDENKSLFIAVQADANRIYKCEFKHIDESFPTIVLEKFLEPFCKKIAKVADEEKEETDRASLKLSIITAINETIDETGLKNVKFLFNTKIILEPTELYNSRSNKRTNPNQSLDYKSEVSEKRILEEPTLPTGAIGFYKIGDEFGIFSNFAHTPVEIDGHTWFTTEHYYQCWKFRGVDEPASLRAVKRILTKKSPVEAAKLGRDESIPRRPDWETNRDDAMRVAVACKAKQHEEMRENLLKTGDALIVEKAITDSYWGYGPDGNGKNMLGHVLMEVREAIKEDRLDQYISEARKRLPEA